MRRYLLGLLMIGMVIAGSCSKDSVVATKMGASIDGKNWASFTRLTVLTGTTFVITGTSVTGEVVIITIYGDALKTYELKTGSMECNASYKATPTASSEDIFIATSGSVTLTKVDKTSRKISGKFQFAVSKLNLDSKIISNGVFNDLEYTEQ